MPKFGKRSKQSLNTILPYGQKLLNELIKYFDFTVLYGHRTVEQQFELYKQGRKEVNGKWVVVNKRKVVTNCDGYKKKSDHNYNPSPAFDICPYPIDWNNLDRFKEMAGRLKQIADELNIKIQWGGDWKKFKDYPHFKVIVK